MKRKFWNWIKNEDESVPDMERTLFLNGMISDETWYGDEVTPQLFKDELNAGSGNITVWINSPGGDVFAAAQIYNMLRDYKGSVTVKIDGIAASAASVIAMAGNTVCVSPVAMMMIHNPATMAMGEAKDMQKAIAMLNEVKESILNAYESKTGLTRARLSHMMDDETWFNAKKAVELGFADKILFDSDEDEKKKEPEEPEKKPDEGSEGEGRRAGELAVFIRFKGCNLNCSYCDTKWANEPACDYEELSPDEICEYVSETGIKNVTLTGGEPLLQKDIRSLVEKLLNKSDIRVEIETNGAVDIAPLANAFSKEKLSLTMDYKLPSSGCEEKMLLSNMEALRKQDTVKFVSGSINDLECAEKIIEKFHLTERCQVFISSVFGSIEPVEIVNFMTGKRMNDLRLQIQMHKVIWNPEERGV